MDYSKSYVAAAIVSLEDLEEVLKAVVNSSVKQPKHAGGISHPHLVMVKYGDGIGFDIGDCIAVTNAQNNVGILLKANYKEPFEKYERLTVATRGVTDVGGLVPGHTYIVYGDNSFTFVKYLGYSMVLVKCQNSYDIMRLKGWRIRPHYELLIPAEK